VLPAHPMTDTAIAAWPAGHLLAASAASPSPLWYATRATGVVALLLLTATVALGVAGVSRLSSPHWPRVITAGLHKNLSLLVVAFVLVHVITTLLDPFVSINPAAIVVPFVSSYRPLWLSLGTIAFDLILALVVTSLLRSRVPYRTWRFVHWLAYVCWPVALWHGLGTGTDSKLPWLLILDAACVLLVAGALLWRLRELSPGLARRLAMAATVAVPVATLVFVLLGPLRPHWAERAGTPVALLGATAVATPAASRSISGVASGATSFTGRVRVTRPGSGQEVITVRAHTGGTAVAGTGPRDLVIVMRGAADGSGISLSSGSVRIRTAEDGPAWSGPITSLNGSRLTASLRGEDGTTEQAVLTLLIRGSQATGQVSLSAQAAP
jgi:sulfoxide reductase heme-binding subunit YedZ